MNKSATVAAVVTSGVLGFASLHPSGAQVQHQPSNKPHTYHQVQALIKHAHLNVPWTGRYSTTDKRLCVEVFNGTNHDIKWHYELAPGFYLKVCSDGNYYVNDGTPFKHLRAY
jgi:putative methionine-R-sulfoxide reductase with GAF domain